MAIHAPTLATISQFRSLRFLPVTDKDADVSGLSASAEDSADEASDTIDSLPGVVSIFLRWTIILWLVVSRIPEISVSVKRVLYFLVNRLARF